MNKTKYLFGGLVNIIKTAINGPAKPPIRKMKPIGPYEKMGPLEPDVKTTYGPYNLPGVTVTALNLSKPQPFPYGEINVEKNSRGTISYPSGQGLVEYVKNRNTAMLQSKPYRGKLYKKGGIFKAQGGGEIKSDNTRVARVPNNDEGVYERTPSDELDFLPFVSTFREAKRIDNGEPNASYANLAINAGMDLLGLGMIGPVLKAASKFRRISKGLKARGFAQGSKEGTFIKQGVTGTINRASGNVKQVPTVDYTNVAMQPLILSLRVPATALFKGDVKKHQFGGELVDTRSDTTYKGYNPNPVPWNAGNGAAGQGPLIIFDYLEDKSKTTNNPYMQTGAPPVLPAFGGPMMLENGTLMNYVTNPAELAARSDFLHTISRTEHGARAIAGSGKIPKGTISEDWQLPKVFKYETQVTPVYKGNPTINTTTKVSIPARTSKFEDRIDGINGKTRSLFKNAAAMEAEDARIVRSGNTRLNRERMRLAEQQIRLDADYNPLYEKLVKKREMAAPQNRAQWEKKIRELLKEFIEKRGLH